MNKTNPTETKQWLLSHNFLEGMRVATAELRNTENFAPFEDLATEGKATIVITIDGANNLHFEKYEAPTKLLIANADTPSIESIKPRPRINVVR